MELVVKKNLNKQIMNDKIQEKINNLRIANQYDEVHKTECTICFNDIDNGDIFLCLTCFNGSCSQHYLLHAKKTSHSLVTILRNVEEENNDNSNEKEQPQIKRLAINAGNNTFQLDKKKKS